MLKTFQINITENTTRADLDEFAQNLASHMLFYLDIGKYILELKKPQRTNPQNRAIHLFFRQLAAELNGIGVTCKFSSILKDVFLEKEWDEHTIKEFIWRPVQKAVLGKDSTTQLSTTDIDRIAKPIIQALGYKYNLGLVFPSQLSKQLEDESRTF